MRRRVHSLVLLAVLAATGCSAASASGPAQPTQPAQASDGGPADPGAGADDGGTGVASSSDAGTAVPNDGVDRTGVTFLVAPTWGQSPDDLAQVDVGFTLQSADPNIEVGVTTFKVWFDGDTPHVFATPTLAGAVTPLYHVGWTCRFYDRGDHADAEITNDSVGSAAVAHDARPFKPYASGLMHIVIRGSHQDGTLWETTAVAKQE